MESKALTKIQVLILIVLIVFVGIVSSALFLLNQDGRPESIDAKIQSLMEGENVPSLVAGIIINDTMVWSQGYGEQSDIDTVYMIGSVTKMFTATAIMQLVENDKLDLDADINTYIPFSVRNPNYPNTPITTRLLLTHRSGLSSNLDFIPMTLWMFDTEALTWANNNLGANITLWENRPTLGEYLDESLNPSGQYYVPENWDSQPGSDYEYSNTGYLLLGYIVEQVADQSFSEYLNENILSPLDMTSTGFDYKEFSNRNAIPYSLEDGSNFAYPFYNNYELGGGALRSTVPDLGKFLIAHMNQGRYQNTSILQPETVDYTQTPQLQRDVYGEYYYSYIGWNEGNPPRSISKNTESLYHSGSILGYSAQITFKIVGNSKYGIIRLINRSGPYSTFYPNLSDLLFEEASRLASN